MNEAIPYSSSQSQSASLRKIWMSWYNLHLISFFDCSNPTTSPSRGFPFPPSPIICGLSPSPFVSNKRVLTQIYPVASHVLLHTNVPLSWPQPQPPNFYLHLKNMYVRKSSTKTGRNFHHSNDSRHLAACASSSLSCHRQPR